jgi:hypothetical protein
VEKEYKTALSIKRLNTSNSGRGLDRQKGSALNLFSLLIQTNSESDLRHPNH